MFLDRYSSISIKYPCFSFAFFRKTVSFPPLVCRNPLYLKKISLNVLAYKLVWNQIYPYSNTFLSHSDIFSLVGKKGWRAS